MMLTVHCTGIAMELLEHGTLASYLASSPQLSQRTRTKIAFDIAHGLAYLHSFVPPVIHRDLKTPNVLVCCANNSLICSKSL